MDPPPLHPQWSSGVTASHGSLRTDVDWGTSESSDTWALEGSPPGGQAEACWGVFGFKVILRAEVMPTGSEEQFVLLTVPSALGLHPHRFCCDCSGVGGLSMSGFKLSR